MQKGSALPFIILLTLILGGLGIFYFYKTKTMNTPSGVLVSSVSESKNKPFTSDKLQIQFDYPKQLTVREDSEEEFNKRGGGDFRKNFKGYVGYEPGKFLSAVVVFDKENFDTNPFSVWIFDNPDDLSIDRWFDKYWYYPFLWGVFDYVSKGHVTLDKEATVSGLMAKYKIVSYQPGSPKYVYLSKEKKMYLLRVIGESGDKILSTFKFQ